MTTHKQKQRIYKDIVDRSIQHAYNQMRKHLDRVPDEIDYEDEDSKDSDAANAIKDIWAIEEEWILDPELRVELSLLSYENDEEEDDDDAGHV